MDREKGVRLNWNSSSNVAKPYNATVLAGIASLPFYCSLLILKSQPLNCGCILVNMLPRRPKIAVMGPEGVGKSSLIIHVVPDVSFPESGCKLTHLVTNWSLSDQHPTHDRGYMLLQSELDFGRDSGHRRGGWI